MVPGKAVEMEHRQGRPPRVPVKPKEFPTTTFETGFPKKAGCWVAMGVNWGAGAPAAGAPKWCIGG